jgi:hypothetical protein
LWRLNVIRHALKVNGSVLIQRVHTQYLNLNFLQGWYNFESGGRSADDFMPFNPESDVAYFMAGLGKAF